VDVVFDCHEQFDDVKIVEFFVEEAGIIMSQERAVDEVGPSRRGNARQGNEL
jgi:hypothetical protein